MNKTKMNKTIIFALMILMLSVGVFATDFTEDNLLFLPLQNVENSATGLLDLSPYGNNASAVGATLDTTEGAFYFDAVNDYLQILNDDTINFVTDQDFTISVWIKYNFTGAGSMLYLFDKFVGNGYRCYLDSSTTIVCYVQDLTGDHDMIEFTSLTGGGGIRLDTFYVF